MAPGIFVYSPCLFYARGIENRPFVTDIAPTTSATPTTAAEPAANCCRWRTHDDCGHEALIHPKVLRKFQLDRAARSKRVKIWEILSNLTLDSLVYLVVDNFAAHFYNLAANLFREGEDKISLLISSFTVLFFHK